jgi:hypothetical protein
MEKITYTAPGLQIERDSETTYTTYGWAGEQTRNTVATARETDIAIATELLEAWGWTVTREAKYTRRPAKLPGEKVGQVLDGSLSDQRAQGLTATKRSQGSIRWDSLIEIDCCAGLPVLVAREVTHGSGSVAEARDILAAVFGPLPPAEVVA